MKIGTRVKLSERGRGFFPASQQDRVGTVLMHEYTLVAVQWDTEAREPVTMMYNPECLEEVEVINRDTPLYTYTADVLGLTLLDQFLGYADCTEVMQGGREQLESLLLFIAEDYKRDEVLWLNAEEAEDDLPGCAVDWRLTRFTLAGLADEIACRASEYAAR